MMMSENNHSDQHPFWAIGVTFGSMLPRVVITSAVFAAASAIPFSANALPKINTKTAAIIGASLGAILGMSHAGKILSEGDIGNTIGSRK